jgi:methionyl-tRNA formyltransferase
MIDPQMVKTVFMGTSPFAADSLEALVRDGYPVLAVYSQPARPAGRGRKVTLPPVAEAAERLGLPVLAPERLRAPEAVAELASLQPDLIVVAAYAQILPRSVLSIPPRGCINVHASLLPRWRGASPIHSAILAGDDRTGVTIMVMDPGMDTGPTLSQSMTRIEDSDTTPSLEARLAGIGAELLLSTLPRYLDGSLSPVPQEESGATYAPILKKSDGLIHWGSSAVEIWRASRAYKPWPGSYSHWQGRMLKVISCRPEPGEAEGVPGRVVPLSGGREAGVVTGEGVLRLEELALEGGKALGIREFLIGHREFPGSLLGGQPPAE